MDGGDLFLKKSSCHSLGHTADRNWLMSQSGPRKGTLGKAQEDRKYSCKIYLLQLLLYLLNARLLTDGVMFPLGLFSSRVQICTYECMWLTREGSLSLTLLRGLPESSSDIVAYGLVFSITYNSHQ